MKYCILALLLTISAGLNAQTHNPKYEALRKTLDSLQKAENFGKAITLLNKALESDSTSAELYCMRAIMYEELKDFSKAYDDFSGAIRSDPKNYFNYLYRAQMMYHEEFYKDALADYRAAFKLATVDTTQAAILTDIAMVKVDMGNVEDPEGDYRAALVLDSNDVATMEDLSLYIWRFKKGDDECIRLLERAVRHDSSDQKCYLNLAFMYGEFGRYQKALDINNMLIDRFGKDARTLNNRGYCKYKLGDLEGALEDINNSLGVAPNNSYAYRNRALVYLDQKKKEDACRDLQKARALGFEKDYGNEVNELLAKYCSSTQSNQSL
jgi:tetratricopeptide (TPR) repeat protein